MKDTGRTIVGRYRHRLIIVLAFFSSCEVIYLHHEASHAEFAQ
jgi:hypothetical protein